MPDREGTTRRYPLSRHAAPEDFEAHGNGWTVDLAPCDPKVRLLFHSVEAEVHYPDAERLAYALLAAVSASRLRCAAKNNDQCGTPGCEREAGSNGYGKCCITCVEGELQGVHLAWCRRRNGDPEPTTSDHGGA